MPTPPEPAVSGLAWSPTADPAAAWWNARVYFDGVPTRRVDVAAAFARTPGVTQQAVAAFLATAQPADADHTRPPWYWDAEVTFGGGPVSRRDVRAQLAARGATELDILAELDAAEFADPKGKHGDLDPSGQWITVTAQHVHINGAGVPDAGGSPQVRKLLANSKAAKKGGEKAGAKADKGGQSHSVEEAAKILGVGQHTVRKWIASGQLKAKGVGGERGEKVAAATVSRKDLDEFAAKHNLGGSPEAEDARHDDTFQKAERGEKVKGKDLQAAHDHYGKKAEAAGNALAKLAGKDGKGLHNLSPEQHEKLAGSIIDAAGRQDKLRGHLDARAATKSAKVKADAEADAKAAKDEADAEAAAKMPAHEIRQKLQKAFNASVNAEGGYVSMPDLYAEAKKEVPGLTKEQFHDHMGALEKSGHVELHAHDSPSKLRKEDADLGVKDGDRLKYYAMAGAKKNAAWAHGPHDEAADAAHKLVESGAKNASPPSRTDLFNALTHAGKMPGTSAGAAAREVHGKLAEKGAVSQDEVREAVHRHNSPEEQKKQNAALRAMGKEGTNHAAGAALTALYEEKTGRSGHQIGQVGKKDLPSKEEVAKRIETATHGRLAGKSALAAAKDIHAHVLAHGQDFMSGHDFAGILDKHAGNDYKHSSSEDVTRAARSGAAVADKHLQRAQDEAGEKYQAAADARQKILDATDHKDSSKLTGQAKKDWQRHTSAMATHGDAIDTLNKAMVKNRESDPRKVWHDLKHQGAGDGPSVEALQAAHDHFRAAGDHKKADAIKAALGEYL